jgi:predicted membrane-bound dolichyl-phosphate-mannose-protein mannosyltransferase
VSAGGCYYWRHYFRYLLAMKYWLLRQEPVIHVIIKSAANDNTSTHELKRGNQVRNKMNMVIKHGYLYTEHCRQYSSTEHPPY